MHEFWPLRIALDGYECITEVEMLQVKSEGPIQTKKRCRKRKKLARIESIIFAALLRLYNSRPDNKLVISYYV